MKQIQHGGSMLFENETNEEFIVRVMNYSKYGGLKQMFIIEALRYYAEAVSKTEPKDDKRSVINPIAWHGVALELLEELSLKYDPKTKEDVIELTN